MIVRYAAFEWMAPDVEAEARRNLLERFMPALRAQPGLISATWATAEDGTLRSITVWESEEAMQRGGERANAAPLLPGQDSSKIPSPSRVETFLVVAHSGATRVILGA